jgi:surfeit locus 1 family protein
VPEGELRVTGRLVVPSANRFALTDPSSPPLGRNAVWQTMDIAALQAAAPFAIQPFLLQLAPEQAGGFVRDWRAPTVHPEKNIGYAIQWFAFALAAVIMFLVLSFRRTGADK